jgi:hypothetical protein
MVNLQNPEGQERDIQPSVVSSNETQTSCNKHIFNI